MSFGLSCLCHLLCCFSSLSQSWMHSQLEMGWKKEGRGRMVDNRSFRFSEKKKEGTMGHFDFLSANVDSGAYIFKHTDNYTTWLLVLNAWKWRLHNLNEPKINSLFRMHKAIGEKKVKTRRKDRPAWVLKYHQQHISPQFSTPSFSYLPSVPLPGWSWIHDHNEKPIKGKGLFLLNCLPQT